MSESPNTVHGRLMESVHIAGYTVARAVDEFGWLLDEDRWKQVGPGYDDIGEFLATLNLAEFRLGIDQRKAIAKRLAELDASQRDSAKALGVGQATIGRDLAPEPHGSVEAEPKGADQGDQSEPEPDGSGAWFQEEVDPAKLAKGRAGRKQRDAEAEQKRIAADRELSAEAPADLTVDLRSGDFREVLADLEGVDAVITDPPYPAEFLPLLADLAAWSDKVLAEDGVLAVLMGQTHLPEVYRLLDGHRPYRWTLCLLTDGDGYVSHPRRVQSNWKPILVYGGGPRMADVLRSEGQNVSAKSHHTWGQDYAAFSVLVERLTRLGDTVVDPFMGSGTTLLAARSLGRHVIGSDIDAGSIATAKRRLL